MTETAAETRAVVLGGGLTGTLAAVALRDHVDKVIVLESDRLPDTPAPRRGLPQGRQSHMLMAAGAEAIDQLLPGTTRQLYAAGAHRLVMAHDILTRSAVGWYPRFPDDAYLISCSRQLIDHVVQQSAYRDNRIELREATRVLGLAGTAAEVTGVLIDSGGRSTTTLAADFVVDATGGRSKAPEWLAGLGLPQVREEFLDTGLAYASRVFEAPDWAREGVPGVLLQPEPHTGRPACGAALMPQENGRWIVPLLGTRGGQPPTDEAGFLAFARNAQHPFIADLIAQARPAGPVRGAHGLANRRRYFDEMALPERFVVLGDSAAVLSPNYATGMSLAALEALALRTRLKASGLAPELGRKIQKDVAKIITGAWRLAIANDRWFPGVETNLKLRGGRATRWLASRYAQIAAESPVVLHALYAVATLSAPQSSLMTLPLLAAVLRGPRKRPLTADEAIAQFPEFRAINRGSVDGATTPAAREPDTAESTEVQ